MKTLRMTCLIALTMVALQLRARADINVARTNDFDLNIGGMGQTLGFGEAVSDPYKNDGRMYLFQKESRLRLNGGYGDYRFNMEMALGGEAAVAAPNPGVTLSLLDLSFDVPVHALGASYFKVGQFLVPYGREGLTYTGYTSFNDRSIAFLGFDVGRDVGATLNLKGDGKSLIAGIFTGGGRDVPQEFLPEKIGVPLMVLRAGLGNIDDDAYNLKQNEVRVDHTKWGVNVNGLYTKDSLVGHSSALNVKLADKSLLLNGNWNPYIAKSPLSQGTWWQAGLDAAVRTPVGEQGTLSAEAELNYGGYSNASGAVHIAAARVQGGFRYESFEGALRYAVLVPDAAFATSGRSITGAAPIHEITPAVSYFIGGGANVKLVLDFPVLVNTPVATEKGVGSYVLTSLPNQTTVLAKDTGTVGRQNVEQARLMLQARF